MASIYMNAITKAAKGYGGIINDPYVYRRIVYTAINKYAKKYNIQPIVIKKIIMRESAFKFKHIGNSFKSISEQQRIRYGLSEAHVREYGLMQTYPHYSEKEGIPLGEVRKMLAYNIDASIHCGVRHLRILFNDVARYLQSKGVTRWFDYFVFGIAAYNLGAQGVKNRLEISGGQVNYCSSFKSINAATNGYPEKILSYPATDSIGASGSW